MEVEGFMPDTFILLAILCFSVVTHHTTKGVLEKQTSQN